MTSRALETGAEFGLACLEAALIPPIPDMLTSLALRPNVCL